MKNHKIKIKPLNREHLDELFDRDLTFGEKIADTVTEFGGSWKFIILFALFLISWIILNSIALLFVPTFDPYPFILLNLVLSFIAAFQAPVIMMSQNRQSDRDRARDELQFDITNEVRAELYILNEKLDIILADKKAEADDIRKAVEEAVEEQNNDF